MTTKNNFDNSSTGTNIEFAGYFDCYQSQTDFTDSIETIQHSSYSKTSIQFYNPHGQIEKDLDIKVKALKTDLYKFVEKYCRDDIDRTWLKSDLNEIVIDFLTDELLTYKYDLDELSSDFDDIEISFVNDIDILTTRGYSQGDYALVLVDRTQLTKLWGKYTDNVQECIDHLFWDAPVWARLTINEDEYHYNDEGDLKQFEWQRDEFIKLVSKSSGVPASVLEDLVPQELSYSN